MVRVVWGNERQTQGSWQLQSVLTVPFSQLHVLFPTLHPARLHRQPCWPRAKPGPPGTWPRTEGCGSSVRWLPHRPPFAGWGQKLEMNSYDFTVHLCFNSFILYTFILLLPFMFYEDKQFLSNFKHFKQPSLIWNTLSSPEKTNKTSFFQPEKILVRDLHH